MPDDQPAETMTTYEVGVYVGYSGERKNVLRSAAKWIERAGLTPTSRELGRTGQHLYSADQVRAAKDAMPGKGTPGQPRPNRTRHESGDTNP